MTPLPEHPRLVDPDEDAPALAALAAMMASQLALCRAEAEEVAADTHPENLHRFRTGLRKARSLAALARKSCFGPHPDFLKKIAAATNRLRDLDVFLESFPGLVSAFPEEKHPAVQQAGTCLECHRREAAEQVSGLLRSPAFDSGMHSAIAFFQRFAEARTVRPDLPLGKFVRKHLKRRYRRWLAAADAARCRGGARKLHALRIQTKKLRVLVREFSPILPAIPGETVRPVLKRLQDELGAFNDLAVQSGILEEIKESGEGALLLGGEFCRRVLECEQAVREALRSAGKRRVRKAFTALQSPPGSSRRPEAAERRRSQVDHSSK